ncbi:MAG TPA: hypothetical protein VFD36_03355 [Kofleriaceae bacterium]|nr:hypothetical protein [Kofleriaceae bacterium]
MRGELVVVGAELHGVVEDHRRVDDGDEPAARALRPRPARAVGADRQHDLGGRVLQDGVAGAGHDESGQRLAPARARIVDDRRDPEPRRARGGHDDLGMAAGAVCPSNAAPGPHGCP